MSLKLKIIFFKYHKKTAEPMTLHLFSKLTEEGS